MASKITSRKVLSVDAPLIIGLGIVPALGGVHTLAQALLLSSGILFVAVCTIAFLYVSRRAIPQRFIMFFTVVIAGGFSTTWAMFAQAVRPDVFHTLSPYPFLVPAMLPVLLAAKTVPHVHGRWETVSGVLITVLLTGFLLCIIALPCEAIGVGTIAGYVIFPRPPFTWAASTPGVLTAAALILGIFAAVQASLAPRSRESGHDA